MKIGRIFTLILSFGFFVLFAQDMGEGVFRSSEAEGGSHHESAKHKAEEKPSPVGGSEEDLDTGVQGEDIKETEMDVLELFVKPRFNNQLDHRYYDFLGKRLARVYPLFLEALHQYVEIMDELEEMGSKKQARRHVRKKQSTLADQYEGQIKDLSVSEGQVFCKLMNRATGRTVFEIIRELRGGWSAFWWGVKGNLVDVDLKVRYDPRGSRDDEFIEALLQSAWNKESLPVYPGYRDFRAP